MLLDWDLVSADGDVTMVVKVAIHDEITKASEAS